MNVESVTIPLAFMAGFFSFISPCVLPLVPVYLGYLTGSAIGGEETPSRRVVFGHALLFVTGFTLVFVFVFGAPFGLLGTFLRGPFSAALVKLGGLFLILFGLHMAGFFRFLAQWLKNTPGLGGPVNAFNDQLDRLILPERRWHGGAGSTPSYTRSLFVGMTFAAGWTPCIGPLLGVILTLAAGGQNFWQAILLLLVYSAGLAAPFLLTALLLTTATGFLRKINRYAHAIEIISALFLITIGVLLVTGQFTALLNSTFSNLAPAWLIDYL